MNSAGETMPRSGCFQRSSASAPCGAGPVSRYFRLVGEREFLALEAPGAAPRPSSARARER